MNLEVSEEDEEFIQQIKHIKNDLITDLKDFKQSLSLFAEKVPEQFFKLTSDVHQRQIAVEKAMQSAAEESLKPTKEIAEKLEQANARLRELERRETDLQEELQSVKNKTSLLKQELKNSKLQKKLETFKGCATVVKKLTGTKFNYQGPNVSGVIANGENMHVFDVDPTKASEEEISKYLWKHFREVAGEDWSDIIENCGTEVQKNDVQDTETIQMAID